MYSSRLQERTTPVELTSSIINDTISLWRKSEKSSVKCGGTQKTSGSGISAEYATSTLAGREKEDPATGFTEPRGLVIRVSTYKTAGEWERRIR